MDAGCAFYGVDKCTGVLYCAAEDVDGLIRRPTKLSAASRHLSTPAKQPSDSSRDQDTVGEGAGPANNAFYSKVQEVCQQQQVPEQVPGLEEGRVALCLP